MGSNNQKIRKLPKELSNNEIELIEANSNMTRAEIKRWYKDFYEFAKGKQLNQEYFIKYYKELLPYNGDCDDFCKLLFNAFDTDHSKTLDFSEILIGFTILSTGDIKKRLMFLFKVYDQNGDGHIDLDELRTAIKAILIMGCRNFELTDEIIEKTITQIEKELDSDSDSKITLEEFLNATLNNKELQNLLCPEIS